MLDPKFIRAHPDVVRQGIRNKKQDESSLDEFLEADGLWRRRLTEADELKALRNTVSEEISRMKRAGQDASAEIARMRDVSDRIKEMDAEVRELEERVQGALLIIPNMPGDGVPIGQDDRDNVIVREWGEPREFDFTPLPHWEIATKLGLIDFERGTRMSGSGFILYTGLGARLERALINWMLDLHTAQHGYKEVRPPTLANRASMVGTGQLPKFEFDMYRLPDDDLFMIPTGEVPVTNINREEILDGKDLPMLFTAYTPCFRREAGAAGKDTRGILRVHEFDKVEMVKYTLPEASYDELEKLTHDAEEVLQGLGIPYRVNLLCTGDTSFQAAKTYDLEAWAPGVEQRLEVSSCSNYEDWQSRRANIRFRREQAAKPEFVHTLNGSGVALPRTVIAILENYQQADGSVVIPEVLRPYMGGLEVIKAL
ncbi:MAG TPA: serine--tRNA ligase [Armatimonadota bacterium]|nr:serine--tRNA ligase [Armatimonadota bacterium]